MSLGPSTGAASPATPGRGREPRRDQLSGSEDRDSDDSSEVLSVGNEPPPNLADLEPAEEPASRTPSPASSSSCPDSYRRSSGPPAPSPPGYSQPTPSPSPSSARSPASSSVTASSPGRPEFPQDVAGLPRYCSLAAQPHQLLKYPHAREPELDYAPRLGHGLGHELVYPGIERLQQQQQQQHRAPLAVPVVARLSLSPPTAMTVAGGLQVATPLGLHAAAAACREGLGLGLQPHLQHGVGHPHQHRLAVDRILKLESPDSPREEPPPAQRTRLLLNGNGNGGCLNGAGGGAGGNGGLVGHDSNGAGGGQHQASLKFSIDNILKGDFGRRITDPISLKKSRPRKPPARPIDLSKDFVESSSEGSEASTRNASPGLPGAGNPGLGSAATAATTTTTAAAAAGAESSKVMQWPAWVYCTRYSDRPSSGPRTRRQKRPSSERVAPTSAEEKRPRTAFSVNQLARLKREFGENKYLTEKRRQTLSKELGLNEAQIKIWFQNKRAKIKKASGQKNPLALQLMAQGLYNHSTVPLSKAEMEQAAELQAN